MNKLACVCCNSTDKVRMVKEGSYAGLPLCENCKVGPKGYDLLCGHNKDISQDDLLKNHDKLMRDYYRKDRLKYLGICLIIILVLFGLVAWWGMFENSPRIALALLGSMVVLGLVYYYWGPEE